LLCTGREDISRRSGESEGNKAKLAALHAPSTHAGATAAVATRATTKSPLICLNVISAKPVIFA
jgi:hypothetical protein